MFRSASVQRRSPHSSGLLFVLLCLAAGCTGAARARAKPAAQQVPTVVSAAVTLQEPAGDPELELEGLRRATSPAATLRRAFLHLHLGRPQAAIDATAEVLYGPARPSANDESFARYLRAEAYEARGRPELGRFDLDRARLLALDPDLKRRLEPRPQGPQNAPRALPMAVLGRREWDAAPPTRGNLEAMDRPQRLTIHHSAMYFRDTRPASCAAQLQVIQRDHMQNRGYADIGYHYLIDPSGRIWQGRDLKWQGAHASGDNNIRNIGICLLGNFVRGQKGQGPTRAQTAAMRQLVVSLLDRYDFGPDNIHCHSDFKATECPGPLLEPLVAQLARDLRGKAGRIAATAP